MDDWPTRIWLVLVGLVSLGWLICRVRFGALRRKHSGEGGPRRIGNNIKLSYAGWGLGIAGVLMLLGMIRFDWPAFTAWLIAVNVAALGFYGIDKFAAALSIFRVPEATLQILALLGGSVGALVGQDVFRHKISAEKRSFRLTLWTIVLLHLVGLTLWIRGRNTTV